MHRFEIKLNHIPTRTLVVVGAIAATLTAVLAFLGAVLLLLISPVILLAKAANRLNLHRHTVTSPHRWPDNEPQARRNTTPPTIDGEYEVIDDGAHKTDRGVN